MICRYKQIYTFTKINIIWVNYNNELNKDYNNKTIKSSYNLDLTI